MKHVLRRLFFPILALFESDTGAYDYKSSHRKVLFIMGCLFTGLATLVAFLAKGEDPGYLLPVFVFGGVGLISLIVSLIGEDRAVAKIWGSSTNMNDQK